MNFESWLMQLKFLANESGLRGLMPEDESLLRDAFNCGWSPEMTLDDMVQQSQGA